DLLCSHSKIWPQSLSRDAQGSFAAPGEKKLLTSQRKSGCCRRFKTRIKASSSAFQTERALKRCREQRSPPAFTSCLKLSSLPARPFFYRSSPRKSTVTLVSPS